MTKQMDKRPAFMSDEEELLYDRTPKWVLWKAMRENVVRQHNNEATGGQDATGMSAERATLQDIRETLSDVRTHSDEAKMTFGELMEEPSTFVTEHRGLDAIESDTFEIDVRSKP